MVLKIKTFASQKPCTFFKALGHPLIAPAFEKFKKGSYPVIYDPEGHLDDFLSMTGLAAPSTHYVQAVEALHPKASLISNIQKDKPSSLLILSFEPEKHLSQIGHLISPACKVESLAGLRIPEEMLTQSRNYLSDLNFSTNFALMREQDGWHTRLKGANCWAKYGKNSFKLWAILFDENGGELTRWEEDLKPSVHSIILDSRDLKKRFKLDDFTGQLFVHITGTSGHSIVKYALDTFHDEGAISSTHDANAWPPEYFAGLPAPRPGEKVILWLQNSHPVSIPTQSVCLNLMGEAEQVCLERDIPPFGTYQLDVSALFQNARWPQQIELQSNHYFVRPRYEVINSKGYQCIAHMNVERTDIKSDAKLKEFKDVLGKGFLLPAPIFPTETYITTLLPTPMSRDLKSMPLKALIYDKEGNLQTEVSLENLPRNHQKAVVLNDVVSFGQDYGHVELMYDFEKGSEADGWLHGLFRYEHKTLPAQAETSFGSHIFNTPITYKNEPQSYKGPPPGLSTGLFLRVDDDLESFCQLIYPVSTEWHKTSDTKLILHTEEGEPIEEVSLYIPQSGSRLWVYQDTFSKGAREKARRGYVIIRDTTCRLFGYHGLRTPEGNFSLDHMFGF